MNKITNNNINFNGISIGKINRRLNCQQQTALMLGQNVSDVIKLTQKVSSKKMVFWDFLAGRYNSINFYKKPLERENSKFVNQVFELVKKPKDMHRDLVTEFSSSFENLSRVFQAVGNKKSVLNFAHKLVKDTFPENQFRKEMLPELLESPFKKQYVRDYKKIKSYLILNKDNSDAVKQLDRMYETKTFDAKTYDRKLREKEIKDAWVLKGTDILNADTYLQNHSKPAEEITSSLFDHFYITQGTLEAGSDKDILNIIKTTTDKNLKLRQNILSKLGAEFSMQDFSQVKNPYIADLNNLFDIIDRDKHSKNFVRKSFDELRVTIPLRELNEILTNVSSKKLDIFKSNAARIITKTKGKERLEALKNEITNPFFETEESRESAKQAIKYRLIKKESALSKISKRIANYFRILKVSMLKDTNVYPSLPVVDEKFVEAVLKNKPEAVVILTPGPEKIFKTVKQMVSDDVLSFISPKLGSKTLERQREAYGKNATKMRLSMLPEIFASVADTRKADRAVGKRRINSSNKDILNLYLKINGSNKKFINYMLKKRNADNTRMFEVKDIITAVDKAEAKIKRDKLLNPDYRARDARKYYNHLFEAKIQQYGKVKRQKTVNTKA